MGGVVISKNADVLIAAGNRDPDAFADPDRFVPARFCGTSPRMSTAGKITLSFGRGIHYCRGAQLARVQLAECLPRASALPQAGIGRAADPGALRVP